MCPIVYDTPEPAKIKKVTSKTFEGTKCVNFATDNLCGGEEPTGGKILGYLFVKALAGQPMKEVTAGMLGEQREKKKDKILGYAFTSQMMGTVKVGDFFLARDAWAEHWKECGKFDQKMLKWGFQMKVDYGKDVETDQMSAAFITFDSGVYEAVDKEDIKKKHHFQVGKIKAKGNGEWTEVKFHEPFETEPLIITQLQSQNTGKLVTARLEKPPTTEKFSIGIETPEGMSDTKDEFIGWLAFEPGEGRIGGLSYIAKTVDGVTNEGTKIEFPPDLFVSKPQAFVSVDTYHGDKAAHTVESIVTDKAIEIKVEGNKFDDASHAGEKLGVFLFQGQSHQAAVFNGWVVKKVVYAFEAGDWSACSTICGDGEMTREVNVPPVWATRRSTNSIA
jgi:hypothetical protein